ncbi:hypothetical protein BVZ79_00602B, partial [Haemophilus influenzae]
FPPALTRSLKAHCA